MKDNVIAQRELTGKDGKKILSLKVYCPKLDDDGNWSCTFSLNDKTYKAHGIDSMQSLILAIDGIRRMVDNMKDDYFWYGDDFLGLPYFPPHYLPKNIIFEMEDYIKTKERDYLENIQKHEVKKMSNRD